MDPVDTVLRAMRPSPTRCALAVLSGTGAVASAVALMAVSGWLISRAAEQPPVMYLMVAVVAVRALGVGRGVLRYAERLLAHDVALRGVVSVRENLYRTVSSARPGSAVWQRTVGLRRGDLLARLGADVDAVADVLTRAVLPMAVSAAAGVGAVVALLLILPGAAAVLAAGLALGGVLAPLLAARAARAAETAAARARAEQSAELMALVEGLPELTVAGAVPARRARLAQLDRELAAALDRAARPGAVAAALGTLGTGLSVLGCLLLGVQAVESGRISPVMLAVVTFLPLATAEVVTGLPAAAIALVRARIAAARLAPLLSADTDTRVDTETDTDSTVQAPPDGAPSGRELAPVRVAARNLSCGWHSGPPAVTGVTLDLRPGARIGLVGPSGSGKTTLLLTLAGLLTPRSGTLIGTGGELRRTVLHLSDDAHVFATTLRENLRLADPGADDDRLLAALQAAGLGDWWARQERGLDTRLADTVGAEGIPLSGGERRRLLIARAALSPAPVVLLDEPAEHLDPATADALVREALRPGPGPFAGRTVVVASHRISPLDTAEQVIVLGDPVAGSSRVRATGSHQELLLRDPGYRSAWEAEQVRIAV